MSRAPWNNVSDGNSRWLCIAGMVALKLRTAGSDQPGILRSCMGLLKLAEKYSDALLEVACKKALSYTASPSYKSIKNILVTSSDKLALETTDTKTTHKAHGITRGADYYRR